MERMPMRALLFLQNPWCLFSLLLIIVLLLSAAALESRSRSRFAKKTRSEPPQNPIPPLHRPTAAPLEALAALYDRLADVHRHLPRGSDDECWLHAYLHDLRSVMDDLYWSWEQASERERGALLAKWDVEVARLDHAITTQLATTIEPTTDRDALHRQLERLRGSG
jgi:hypothetical protein